MMSRRPGRVQSIQSECLGNVRRDEEGVEGNFGVEVTVSLVKISGVN